MRHRAVVAVCHPFAAGTDLDLGARILAPMHRLDRGTAQAGDRARRLDREFSDLVLLVEPAFDFFDDSIEALHCVRMVRCVI